MNSCLRLWDSLPDEELTLLSHFYNSPVAALSQSARTLFAAHQLGEESPPPPDALWAKIYPQKPFNPGSLRKLYSDLHQSTQLFLAIQSLRKCPEWVEYLKFQAANRYSHEVLSKAWRKTLYKVGLQDEANPIKVPQKTHQLLIAHELYLEKYRLEIRSRKETGQLQKAMDHLDAFYLLKKLKLLCETELVALLLDRETEILLSPDVRALSQQPKFRSFLLIQLYSQLYELVSHLREVRSTTLPQSLEALLQFVKKHIDDLAVEEARELLNYLFNLCTGMSRIFSRNMEKQFDEIFHLRVQSKSLLIDGEILTEEFKNRISHLLIYKGPTEAQDFFNHYAEHLAAADQGPSRAFCQGCIQFYQGRFGAMRKSFLQVEIPDPFFTLDMKILSIKAYFLENESMPLQSSLEAFKKFLQRHKKLHATRLKTYHRRLLQFERLFRLLYGSRQATNQLTGLRMEVEAFAVEADRKFWQEMFQRIQLHVKK